VKIIIRLYPLKDLCLHTQAPIRKRPPEIHFVYLGNKDIQSIFQMFPMISILFSKKCHLFNNFAFFFQIILFWKPYAEM